MVFSSITFLFYFLPIFLIVYYLLPKKIVFKNVWFLLVSLAFYFWGENLFILVLLTSIVLNYSIGILLSNKSKSKNVYLFIGIASNLLILITYKYSPFIIENFTIFFNVEIGSDNSVLKVLHDIHLPLGISFFTFQGMSYLLDIYRDDAKAEKNIINVALYIAMFPQLIAGPIVRFKEISQAIHSRSLTASKLTHGVNLFIIGMAYKLLLANTLAIPADKIYALSADQLSFCLSWIGTLAYTLQIYFDFCGYSTMAVGLGLMLGIKFPKNFNFPYISKSITEFWRRWHITLSLWFRDYLYIPLGGNRKGNYRTYFNLFMVFVLCGIWHGASWAFLVWGIYHGLFLVIERLGLKKGLKKLPIAIQHVYTLLIVMVGWVFFRAETFDKAFYFIKTMFGLGKGSESFLFTSEVLQNNVIIAFIVGSFLCTPIVNRFFFNGDQASESLMDFDKMPELKSTFLWYSLVAFLWLLCILSLVNQTYNPFIYFRF